MSLRYALLAGLALEPRSGYDLTRWFEKVASHYWSATHSSIYPALAELERDGLVAHTLTPSERGPARKVYRLLPAGRAALLAWVETPAIEPALRDEQMIKALCFGLLPPAVALDQLAAVHQRHAARLANYRSIAHWLEQADDPVSSCLAPVARLGMLLTLRRGIGHESAYLSWCDEAAELIRAFASEQPQPEPK